MNQSMLNVLTESPIASKQAKLYGNSASVHIHYMYSTLSVVSTYPFSM